MKLLAIRVQNHARLQDCDLAVRDHLVLVGANDVGKSSLLLCLDLLLGSSTAQLYARVTPDDVRDQACPFIVEATLTDMSPDEVAAFPDEVTVDPVTIGRRATACPPPVRIVEVSSAHQEADDGLLPRAYRMHVLLPPCLSRPFLRPCSPRGESLLTAEG